MPFTSDQQLAVRIVEPYASKSLTKRAAADLAKSIATALYLRSKATLTYGPQEVARIAGREDLPAAKDEWMSDHFAAHRCVNGEPAAGRSTYLADLIERDRRRKEQQTKAKP